MRTLPCAEPGVSGRPRRGRVSSSGRAMFVRDLSTVGHRGQLRDCFAHLPDDNLANLESEKMESLGKVMSLVLTVLSREAEY